MYLTVLDLSCGSQGPPSSLKHAGSSVLACGIQLPDQGLYLGPRHWEHGVLAPGPPGKFPVLVFFDLDIFEVL